MFSRSRMYRATAAPRVVTWSLRKMARRWVFTVSSDSINCRATAALVAPCATHSRTSRSRGVRSASRDGAGRPRADAPSVDPDADALPQPRHGPLEGGQRCASRLHRMEQLNALREELL